MLQRVPVRRQTTVSLALAAAGVALLIWQVRSAGTADLLAYLRQVGWGFLIILALSFGRMVMRSMAWRALILQRVPLSGVLAAVLTGDAIGNVMPGSLLVSEPAKAAFLGRGVKPSHAFAALAAENYLYSVSVAVYIIIGTAAMLTVFDVPEGVRNAGVSALLLMAVVLAGAAWLAWQRPSVVSTVLSRLPMPGLTAMVERVRDIETRAYGSVGGQTARVVRVVGFHLVFHALSFLELWYTVYLLTGRSEPLASFVLGT